MFTFLKLIKPFFLPPVLIAIGMLASILLWPRKRGRRILILTLVAYYLLSIQPVAYGLAHSLENQFSTAFTGAQDAEVIVILAGGANKKEGRRSFAELGGVSWKRLWHGIELHRELENMPVLYSGGSGDPFDPVSHEAELAKQYALAVGISEDMFWIESSSRNTYESALAIKHILEERFSEKDQHQVILVTSASHMRRSLGVMRKAGISAVPAAADFSQGVFRLNPLSFFPSHAYFSSSVSSIHEWVGIAGYWLMGRI